MSSVDSARGGYRGAALMGVVMGAGSGKVPVCTFVTSP